MKKEKPRPSDVPALSREETLHLKLVQASQRLQAFEIEWCELAVECVEAKVHQFKGFADPVAYLESVLGRRYRTVRRYLTIGELLHALPEGAQRDRLRAALSEIGVHKSAALAPVILKEPQAWEATVHLARSMTQEAVQDYASHETGALPRGQSGDPSRSLLAALEKYLPPEVWPDFEETFKAGMVLADTQDIRAVLIGMEQEVRQTWRDAAERVRKGAANL